MKPEQLEPCPNNITTRKIFLVGHNKCGTRSLHEFFQANGIKSVHFDNGRLAVTMDRNCMAGRPLLEGYEHFEAYCDMHSIHHGDHCPYRSLLESVPGKIILSYQMFELLDSQYPESLFVYNTRPVEDWLDSRLRHAGGVYAESYRQLLSSHLGMDNFSISDLLVYWAEEFRSHEDRLRAYFGNSERYLELDITCEGAGEMLPAFLEAHGYIIANRVFPKIGSGSSDSAAFNANYSEPKPAGRNP